MNTTHLLESLQKIETALETGEGDYIRLWQNAYDWLQVQPPTDGYPNQLSWKATLVRAQRYILLAIEDITRERNPIAHIGKAYLATKGLKNTLKRITWHYTHIGFHGLFHIRLLVPEWVKAGDRIRLSPYQSRRIRRMACPTKGCHCGETGGLVPGAICRILQLPPNGGMLQKGK